MPPSRILCLLPHLTHPATAMRIDMLQEQGFHIEAMGYKRDFSHCRFLTVPVTPLGHLRHGNYARRIPLFIGSIAKIRAAIRRSELVYTFGADLAGMAFLAGVGLRRPIILDVFDIRDIQVAQSLAGRVVRALDTFIVERCRLLVLSSSGYHHYFHNWLKVNPRSLVIEMKVEAHRAVEGRRDDISARAGRPFFNRPLRIGYFCRLRDQWSLEFLEHLTRSSNGKFEVVLAGVVSPKIHDFDRFLQGNPALEYKGSFRHPEDLPKLYASVDMTLACYPPVIPDRWSQSMRYYESCFFQNPLIVRAGTRDAIQVERHHIGFVINEREPVDAAKEFCAITAEDWCRWRTNLAALPPHVYLLTHEAKGLAEALQEIAREARHEQMA